MPLSSGTRLGAYEVIAALGAGGMGEVYRARDTRLGRDVAIKVLPTEVAKDTERLARFRREAQLLAALNHPNIAAIHGLDEADGQMFLVLELVEGEDLAQRLTRGALPIEEAMAVALQMADALEEAHAKGIVHRDLKPANVKVTPAGKVKVLDFGLAKAYVDDAAGGGAGDTAHSPTMTSPAMTARGMILGTASYMAPEQARGKAVDKRADIWAFGCVLYEMLTGTQAFPGETVTDILAAVVKNEPTWGALPAGTPRGLHTVLRRCLRKDPNARLHDIADARIEMTDPDPGPLAVSPASTVHPASRRWLAPALIAALAIGAASGVFWRASRDTAPAQLTGVRLGGPPIALYPNISPDGQLLAFLAMVDGQTQVAVMKPGTGNWTVLTSDRTHGLVEQVAWSPDGSRIYYDRRTDGPAGVYSVPALGGDERLVLENAGAPVPMPDGSLLVTRINSDRQYQFHRLSPSTGQLDALPMGAAAAAVVSGATQVLHDGRILTIGEPLRGDDRTPGLYTLSLETGEIRRFGPRAAVEFIRSLAVRPSDGAVLIVLRDGSTYRVLEYPPDGTGEPRSVLTLLSQPRLTLAPDGAIYASIIERPGEVVRFDARGGAAQPLPVPTDALVFGGAIALDDGRALFATRAGSGTRVLVLAPGKDPTALVDTDDETAAPMTSLGQGRVALMVGSGRAAAIAIVAVDTGRILKRFAVSPGITSLGASPDGKTLFYSAGTTISAISVDGGSPRTIGPGNSLTVDPDSGDLIVMLQERDRFKLARIAAAGGEARPITIMGDLRLVDEPLTSGAVRQGRVLVPVATTDSWFWFPAVLDLRTGQLDRIAVDHQTDFHYLTWTPDGRVLGTGLGIQSALWKFVGR